MPKRKADWDSFKIRFGQRYKAGGQCPDEYRQIFDDINYLGRQTYDTYVESGTFESQDKPWMREMKSRTKRLSNLTHRCSIDSGNEEQWRMYLEPMVFARFLFEMSCTQCRGRVWRSMREVSHEGYDLESIAARQKDRFACKCDGSEREDPSEDTNRVFCEKIEGHIIRRPSEGLVPSNGKSETKIPDRVIGLRSTSLFVQLFEGIEHDLQSSPFKSSGSTPLFPFLVFEAKGSRSNSDATSAKNQSVVAIDTFLDAQQNLKSKVTDLQNKSKVLPLVWFVYSVGAEWGVTACIPRASRTGFAYSGIELWSGLIKKEDDALQLLLIIDYIVDWARDRFRTTLLSALKVLAKDDSSTLAGDSAIISRLGNGSMLMEDSGLIRWQRDMSANEESYEDTLTNTTRLPTPSELAQAANERLLADLIPYVKTTVKGFFITGNNLDALQKAIHKACRNWHPAHGMKLAMCGKYEMSASTINAMERLWTNQAYEGQDFDPLQKFHVSVVISASVNDQWEIVRKLSYIAIANRALQQLRQLDPTLFVCWSENSTPLEQADIITALKRIRFSSLTDTFTSALGRKVWQLRERFCEVHKCSHVEMANRRDSLADYCRVQLAKAIWKHYGKGLGSSKSYIRTSSWSETIDEFKSGLQGGQITS